MQATRASQSDNSENSYLHGLYAPVSDERTVSDLPVLDGEIPKDLRGAYIRNGPNPKRAPKGQYHWFDGDGMLHAIHFEDGRASYRNRYVRTEHLAAEDDAQCTLWTGLMESTLANPKGAPYKDSANTDILLHGDALLATWYITGVPYRVDAKTLDTLGPTDFGRGEPLRISAHAKSDSRTGELMFFEYGPVPPYLRYGVVDRQGRLVRLEEINLPGPRLPHDMAITEHYSVLMDLPVFFNAKAFTERRWVVDYHRDMPARFGILPRHGDNKSTQWFEAEPCYIYHTINAWEEGDEVVMVGCRCDDPTPAIDPRDGQWARMMANLRLTARLYRWRFNLLTGATREEPIDDRNSEFPSIHAGFLGHPSRYAYNMNIASAPTLLFDGVVKYDTTSGQQWRHEFGPGRFGSEAPFAPRVGATDEDDGYLVSFVHDQTTDRSELLVLDARNLGAGPYARIALPQRVPLGFHACWVPGSDQ